MGEKDSDTNHVRTIILLLIIALPAASIFSEESGLASWYGGKFQGRQTASGEIFDTNEMTAAHKSLPFGSIVRVKNISNDLTVEVRINDRGPFVKGRIIDLSRAAAEVIELTKTGIAPVVLEVLHRPENNTAFNIQIGAYKRPEYADRLKTRLESAGFKTRLFESEEGIIRVTVPNIPEEELPAVEKELAKAGFSDWLVRRITK